jgi:hypothetical protein
MTDQQRADEPRSVHVRIDVKTTNPSNGQRGNSRWAAIAQTRERKRQRSLAEKQCRAQAGAWMRSVGPQRVVVSLCRIAPSKGLDQHDGLRSSLKHVVDGIADFLGVDDGDETRVGWRYTQRRGRKGEYAVEVKIEDRTGAILVSQPPREEWSQ